MNDVHWEMLNQFVFVYLEDILIFFRSIQCECEFHASSVSLLCYHIIRGSVQVDPSKVKAVIGFPVPDSRKQLQRFLGFSIFYHRFMRNYNRVEAPLIGLTSAKTPLTWPQEASLAFRTLKEKLTTTPILLMPDPDWQFVEKVDTSDVGVGGADQKLHPCAFFTRRLTPAERNYDIRTRELLAVKLAL